MISRRTTRLLTNLFTDPFKKYQSRYGESWYSMHKSEADVYDFLYQNDYPAWFCNAARDAASNCYESIRPFEDFVLKIHTGESLEPYTLSWTWPQREKLGQELLRDLAEDVSKLSKDRGYVKDGLTELVRSLELDGYIFRGDTLLTPEEGVLDAREQGGVLEGLYTELRLQNAETIFHHLELSEQHYLAKRWDDSISNSRKFLEGVLQEVSANHHLAVYGSGIGQEIYSRPVRVRDYLESSGLLEPKEKAALSSSYGLLSETGAHPYMAENDQARLLRHLALTFSQFALLRLKGFKHKNTP